MPSSLITAAIWAGSVLIAASESVAAADALIHWQACAETYAARYQQRVLYNRVGWVERTALIENVRADIDLARQWSPGSLPGDKARNPANPKAD